MLKRLRALTSLALCLALLLLLLPDAGAQKIERRTIRVAYPIQAGLTALDEHGNYTGYTYEYLEEIAQYTGWDYEFVQMEGDPNESLTLLMDQLEAGELDLMGAMYYSDVLATMFDFSSYSYGTAETVLQAPYDASEPVVINSRVLQTFRIAVIGTASRSLQELEDYCTINLIEPEYVYCQSDAEQLQAVLDGRADMLLNTSMMPLDGVHTVARFAPKPFYFVTTKDGDSHLMEALNAAILNIEQSDPTFSTRLYEKYFSSENDQMILSDAEHAYIAASDELRVGLLDNQPPYQYGSGGDIHGISVDLLDYISQQTGLQFRFVSADSPASLTALAERGEIDLVAGMSYDYALARGQGLSMTRPYLSSQYLLLINERSNESSIQDKRLALTDFSPYNGAFLGQVQRYPTLAACIDAVSSGEADYTYVDTYTAQYYINLPEYQSLKTVPQTYDSRGICFGVVKPASTALLSILNKCVSTISDTDLQGIINQNTILQQPFTLSAFIKSNPVETVILVSAVLLLIIAALAYFLWQRARHSRKTALELKKHFRVYALVNEHFFEYDYQTHSLLVFVPSGDGTGQPKLTEYSRARLTSKPGQAFLGAILNQPDGTREVRILCHDGMYHWVRVALETVYDGESPAYVLGKVNLIDQERQERDALLEKAQTDSLTHLSNAETTRRLIAASLAALPKGAHGGLILIDVDRFKSINDHFGHLEGDLALVRMSEILRATFRADDVVGRPGGDEFVVYMPRIDGQHILAEKCALLCDKVRHSAPEGGVALTVSVGAALSSSGDEYESLYARADLSLYQSKAQGRDQFYLDQEDGPA